MRHRHRPAPLYQSLFRCDALCCLAVMLLGTAQRTGEAAGRLGRLNWGNVGPCGKEFGQGRHESSENRAFSPLRQGGRGLVPCECCTGRSTRSSAFFWRRGSGTKKSPAEGPDCSGRKECSSSVPVRSSYSIYYSIFINKATGSARLAGDLITA